MKILFIQNSLMDFRSGCHYYRLLVPSIELKRRGHEVKYISYDYKEINKIIDWADAIYFQRLYTRSVTNLIKYAKKNGKKVLYDIDDDLWTIPEDNPAKKNDKKLLNRIESIMKLADCVTTTTEPLAEILRQFNNNVKVVPNSLDFTKWNGTPREQEIPVVAYSGSASHWGDFLEILPTLKEVQDEHPFYFVLQGFTGEPIEVAMFVYEKMRRMGASGKEYEYQKTALKCYDVLRRMQFSHIPFYMPEQFPMVLQNIHADIGICPLKDNVFNKSKSCIKFYEYAATRTVTLAPDLLPYSEEVNCRYKNLKEFKERLINLLTHKQERQRILKEQREFVRESRDIVNIGDLWEEVIQKL